jgi:hypothetical protein
MLLPPLEHLEQAQRHGLAGFGEFGREVRFGACIARLPSKAI